MEGMFEKGKLVVVADLVFPVEKEVHLCNETNDQIRYNTEDSDKEFVKNMKSIYEFGSFSDFTVFCGGEKFLCHRNILAARSDVFKAMLNNETKENIEQMVEIEDS